MSASRSNIIVPPFSPTWFNDRFVTLSTSVAFQIGFWLWELGNTFSLDWRLFTGRYPLRAQGVCFLLARLSLTAALGATIAMHQGYARVACDVVWWSINVFSILSLCCSHGLFVLRVMAAWEYSPFVTVPLTAILSTLFGLWIYETDRTDITAVYDNDRGWTCQPKYFNVKDFFYPFFISLGLDYLVSALTLWKLYKISKSSHLLLLQIVVRDSWLLGIAASFPTLASVIAMSVTDHALLVIMVVPMTVILHATLASRAYAAFVNAGLTMLPNEDRGRVKVLNGRMMDAQALKRLVFKPDGINAGVTDSIDDGMGTRLHQERWLPGALSRDDTQDVAPPFAAYCRDSAFINPGTSGQNHPSRRSLRQDDEIELAGTGARFGSLDRHRERGGENEGCMSKISGRASSSAMNEMDFLYDGPLSRPGSLAEAQTSLQNRHEHLWPTTPATVVDPPVIVTPPEPSAIKDGHSHGSRSIFCKGWTGALSRHTSHGVGFAPSSSPPKPAASSSMVSNHAPTACRDRSQGAPIDVLVGVNIDVRVEQKEAHPLPAIFERLGGATTERSMGTSKQGIPTMASDKDHPRQAAVQARRYRKARPAPKSPSRRSPEGAEGSQTTSRQRLSFWRSPRSSEDVRNLSTPHQQPQDALSSSPVASSGLASERLLTSDDDEVRLSTDGEGGGMGDNLQERARTLFRSPMSTRQPYPPSSPGTHVMGTEDGSDKSDRSDGSTEFGMGKERVLPLAPSYGSDVSHAGTFGGADGSVGNGPAGWRSVQSE